MCLYIYFVFILYVYIYIDEEIECRILKVGKIEDFLGFFKFWNIVFDESVLSFKSYKKLLRLSGYFYLFDLVEFVLKIDWNLINLFNWMDVCCMLGGVLGNEDFKMKEVYVLFWGFL